MGQAHTGSSAGPAEWCWYSIMLTGFPQALRKFRFDPPNKDWLEQEKRKERLWLGFEYPTLIFHCSFSSCLLGRSEQWLREGLGLLRCSTSGAPHETVIATQCKKWKLNLLWLTVYMNIWEGKILTDVYLDQIKRPYRDREICILCCAAWSPRKARSRNKMFSYIL